MNTEAVIERFVSIEMLKDRYNSPGPMPYPSLYPSSEQVECKNKIIAKKKEIERAYQKWREDIQFYEERTPTVEEYMYEIDSIKKIIRFIDHRMDPDRFFQNGPNDTELCKKYLQRMKEELWDEDIEDLKCMFHATQWLLRKKAEDCKELKPVEEGENPTGSAQTEDKELLRVLDYFEIGVESHIINICKDKIPDKYILAAIMYIYQEEKKPWANNAHQLAEKVVSVLRETKDLSEKEKLDKAKTIYKRINRVLKEEMGYLNPDDLTIERIMKKTGCLNDKASIVINNYEIAHKAVLQCRKTIGDNKGDDRVDTNDIK